MAILLKYCRQQRITSEDIDFVNDEFKKHFSQIFFEYLVVYFVYFIFGYKIQYF